MNFKVPAITWGAGTTAWTAAALFTNPNPITLGSTFGAFTIAGLELAAIMGVGYGVYKAAEYGFNYVKNNAPSTASISEKAVSCKDTASAALTSAGNYLGSMFKRSASANAAPAATPAADLGSEAEVTATSTTTRRRKKRS